MSFDVYTYERYAYRVSFIRNAMIVGSNPAWGTIFEIHFSSQFEPF